MRYGCIIKMILLARSLIVETQNQEGYYFTFHNCKYSQVNYCIPVQTLGIFAISLPHVIILIYQQVAEQDDTIVSVC